jgi:PTH2 family peptidyl-tRNA hydrolase
MNDSNPPNSTISQEPEAKASGFEFKQVIVVRKDLGMKKGKIAAQVAHASLGAILQQIQFYEVSGFVSGGFDIPTRNWLSGPFVKVVLACNSEEELLGLEKAAKDAGIRCCLIIDAGRTEFNGVPTMTCLSIGPDSEDNLNKITGSLKLL